MKKVIINGSIYATGRKDGIPRYATEIIKELDKIKGDMVFEVVSPVPLDFTLDSIKVTLLNPKGYASGKLGAEFWKQISFVNYANKQDCITLDLGMMLPFRRNDVCTIYDCQPERFMKNYIKGVMSKYINKVREAQRKNAAKNSKIIVTDSNDAKKDIIHFLGADESKIRVVYCAWQHYKDIEPDFKIFDRYQILKEKRYCFSLGSRFKHKNIEWVFAAAKQNPEYVFVITGYNNVAAYSETIVNQAPDNTIFTGYLSDEEIKALMTKCTAFIHPSFSEGFGMPPLEALSVGCELILSNASCLPEVYEDYAHYINPYEYENINIDTILKNKIDGRKLLEKYSWEKSAQNIYSILNELCRN